MSTYYLAHHGILGQKWGVRRFQNPDGSYTSAGRSRYGIKSDIRETYDTTKKLKKEAKINKKAASRLYNTAYNTADVYSSMHPIGQFTNPVKKKVSNEFWKDAWKKQNQYKQSKNKLKDAKEAYKDAKRERKELINDNVKEIRRKNSFKDNFLYNEGTFGRAATLMADYKDMSYEKAIKEAKKEAWRNSAWATAAIATVYDVSTGGPISKTVGNAFDYATHKTVQAGGKSFVRVAKNIYKAT